MPKMSLDHQSRRSCSGLLIPAANLQMLEILHVLFLPHYCHHFPSLCLELTEQLGQGSRALNRGGADQNEACTCQVHSNPAPRHIPQAANNWSVNGNASQLCPEGLILPQMLQQSLLASVPGQRLASKQPQVSL